MNQARWRVALAVAAAAIAIAVILAGRGRDGAAPAARDPGGLEWVDQAALPAEARQTIRAIDAGGPFRYDRDGAVFGNRERVLPVRPRSFYREYTVPTPGSRDRGARRIVTGDGTRLMYYTDDHYGSFRAVRR